MCLKLYFFILVSNLLVTHFQVCGAQNKDIVKFYRNLEGRVDQLYVTISQCTNLPVWWEDEVVSIDTRGNCAALFDQQNCTGNFIEITPTSPSHDRLDQWEFAERTVSAGPCRHQCSPEITGIIPDAPFQIEIYSGRNFGGRNKSLTVTGCTRLSPPLNWNDNILSVKTQGHCIQLYNNTDCSLDSGRSIELRQGTPFHNDLGKWGMRKPKSISHCGYKCSDAMLSSEKPGKGDVIVFNETYFQGRAFKINTNDSKCHNVTYAYMISKSATSSIQMGNTTCITLFDERGCRGRALNATKSIWDLSKSKFNYLLQSVKACDNNETIAHVNLPTSTPRGSMYLENTSSISVEVSTAQEVATNSPEVAPSRTTAATTTQLPEVTTEQIRIDLITNSPEVISTTTTTTPAIPQVTSPTSSFIKKDNNKTDHSGLSTLITVLVIVFVIPGGIVVGICYPRVKRSVVHFVGNIRKRVFYRSLDRGHSVSGDFHWKRSLLVNEQENGEEY